MRAVEDGKVDTSHLEQFFDLENPCFLFKYLTELATNGYILNYGDETKSLWHVALENNNARGMGRGTFVALYKEGYVISHLAGPSHLHEYLLSPKSFEKTPSLAQVIYYLSYDTLFYYADTLSLPVKDIFNTFIVPLHPNAASNFASFSDYKAINLKLSYLMYCIIYNLSNSNGSKAYMVPKANPNVDYIVSFLEKPITDPAALTEICYTNGDNALKSGNEKMANRFFTQAEYFSEKAGLAPRPKVTPVMKFEFCDAPPASKPSVVQTVLSWFPS